MGTLTSGRPRGGRPLLDPRRKSVLRLADELMGVARMWWQKKKSRRDKTRPEVADLIERFLDCKSLYPQEWNDFVESSQRSKDTDAYRRRCYELDPLVNRPGDMDPTAVGELRSMIDELRKSGEAG
jgi:hypothetical protein